MASIMKVAKAKAQPYIEEIKGSCPRCGGELRFKEHVCAWEADGTPSQEDTFTDIFCDNCQLFWCPEEAD